MSAFSLEENSIETIDETGLETNAQKAANKW
jgi:hypothetical protein